MDAKAEDQAIPPPKMALAYNVQAKKAGGYSRRNGHAAMTALAQNGDTITGQRAVRPYRDSAVMFNTTKAYEYSSASARWVDKGAALPTKLTVAGIHAPGDLSVTHPAVATTTNGYSVYAYNESDQTSTNTIKMMVVDSAGTVLGSRTLDAAPSHTFLRVAAVGVRVWVVWQAAANTLKTFIFDGTSATTVNSSLTSATAVSSATDFYTAGLNFSMDIAPRPTAGNVFVAYRSTIVNGAVNEIKFGFLSTSGALGSTSTIVPVANATSIAVAVQSSEALHGIVYGTTTVGNDLYAAHRSWNGSAWSATATSTFIDTAMTVGVTRPLACIYSDSITLSIYYSEVDTTNSIMRTYRSAYDTAGTITARANTHYHTYLTSKPVIYQGETYFWGYQCGNEDPILPYSTDNPALYLIRNSDGYPAARVFGGTALGPLGNAPPTPVTLSGGEVRAALVEMTKVFGTGTTNIRGATAVRDVKASFLDAMLLKTFEFGDCLYAPGGILMEYDGTSFVESGFLRYATPSSWSITASNAGGGLTAAKQYFVVVIPEWLNARGGRHLGTHGGSKSVTLGGADNRIVVVIETVSVTLKRGSRDDFVWGIYITEDATPSADSVFYRVGAVDNNPSADNVTFNITFTDADIELQEQLYLGTGELDNVAPPGGYIVTSGNGRVAVAGGRTAGHIITVSKTGTDGRALEFSDALTIVVPEDGGPITAMEWLNETLVVFKEERIYLVRGDGPNNLGQGVFAEPELRTTDCGAITQQGVVATPMGVMFQAKRGIMLLSGDQSVTYIGAPVESPPSPGAALGTCVDAVVVPKKQHVRFSDGTVTHVFDYQYGLWYVWSTAADGPSCIYGDVHTMPVGNAVWQQSDSVWQDAGTDYFAKLSLAWLSGPDSKMTNIRVRKVGLLGKVVGTSALAVNLKYDGLDSTEAAHETTGLAAGPLRHVIYPANCVTNQFRVDIIDADTTGSPTYTATEGMVWVELTLNALVKKGIHIR